MASEAKAPVPDIAVSDDPDHSRYEVTVGGVHAGAAYYEMNGQAVAFTHTEVDSRWEGKGIGSALAKAALDDVRATGRTAVPRCPFIAAYIRRHPEYSDLVVDRHQGVQTGWSRLSNRGRSTNANRIDESLHP